MKTILIILLLSIITIGHSYSQDIKGGYIHSKWIFGYTYKIEIKLFCDSSLNINRPTIPVTFGNASAGSYTLSSSTTVNGINIKTYTANRTFGGPGNYLINYEDTFRISNIKNIINSQNQHINISTFINIGTFGGQNTSPTIQNFPINLGLNGNQVFYDPSGLYDIDGDSLTYSLVNCYAVNYYLPNGVTLDNSGILSFSKDSIGLYAFSYKINEWRNDGTSNYFIVGSSQIDFVMDINSSVGLTENNDNKNNTFIFPNPVFNELTISSAKYNFNNSKVEIINCFGQIVNQTSFRENINVLELPRGMYFLKIIDKENRETCLKFIKQ